MGFSDVMTNIGNKMFKQKVQVLIDGVTTDKVLLDLRRRRQEQLELGEKERLRKQIAIFEKDQRAIYLYGIKGKLKLNSIIDKKKSSKFKKGFLTNSTMMGKTKI